MASMVFAYFCRRMDKSKASGGTKPAGFVFQKKHSDNKLAIQFPLYHEV
jgi:hypothetical protein